MDSSQVAQESGATGSARSTPAAVNPSQPAEKPPADPGTKPDRQGDLTLPASGLPPIPGHLVQAIRDGKFIDLADLLPEALREVQFDKACDKKEDAKSKKKHSIASPLDWMVAYATYSAATVHFNPKRAFEMAAYSSIVLTLARDIRGMAWAKYDRLFRQAAAMNPQLPWHRREQDIWLMSATESTTLAAVRPPSQQGLPQAQRSVEICRNWNRGACPFFQCRFRHICATCQEPGHVTPQCPLRAASPKAPATGKAAKP